MENLDLFNTWANLGLSDRDPEAQPKQVVLEVFFFFWQCSVQKT